MHCTESTYLYTAYTGSVASLFGGVTICKKIFLNQTDLLTTEDKESWEHVKMVIIDRITLMGDEEFHILDLRLQELRNRTQPFGRFSIVFAGDFL